MSKPANPILVPTLDELGVEFERLGALYRAAADRLNAAPDDDYKSEREAHDAASAALAACCEQISQLPPQKPEHLRLLARAIDWLVLDNNEGPAFNTTDDWLTYWLVRGTVDGLPVNQRVPG